jgi:hypothetical protein
MPDNTMKKEALEDREKNYSGIIKHKTAIESSAKTLHHEAVF